MVSGGLSGGWALTDMLSGSMASQFILAAFTTRASMRSLTLCDGAHDTAKGITRRDESQNQSKTAVVLLLLLLLGGVRR